MNSRDLATTLFGTFSALNRQIADAAQREYESLTPEQRKAMWAERRAELARVRAECKAMGIDL